MYEYNHLNLLTSFYVWVHFLRWCFYRSNFCIPSIPTSIQFSVYKVPYECGKLMFTIVQDNSLISNSNSLFYEHHNLANPISYLACQIAHTHLEHSIYTKFLLKQRIS